MCCDDSGTQGVMRCNDRIKLFEFGYIHNNATLHLGITINTDNYNNALPILCDDEDATRAQSTGEKKTRMANLRTVKTTRMTKAIQRGGVVMEQKREIQILEETIVHDICYCIRFHMFVFVVRRQCITQTF